jgi:hypothetical protein
LMLPEERVGANKKAMGLQKRTGWPYTAPS